MAKMPREEIHLEMLTQDLESILVELKELAAGLPPSAASGKTAYQVALDAWIGSRIRVKDGVASLCLMRDNLNPKLDTYGDTLRPAMRAALEVLEDLSRAVVNAADALHENRPAHEQVTNARRALGCEVLPK